MLNLEKEFIYYINQKYINRSEVCSYGNINIYLNKYNKYKKNPFCFRYTKRKCRKIYPLLDNSFFLKILNLFQFLVQWIYLNVFQTLILT